MRRWKDNVSFVLVEPQEPGNIGSAARAMKNMGFHTLELVRPAEFLNDEARQMACNAADMLENAALHAHLAEAIKDKSLVIGNTRRRGRHRGLTLPVTEAAKKILAAAGRSRIAILFGRERNGLTNRELESCGFLMTIPSNPSSPSLNLAQSVLLVAYELGQEAYRTPGPSLINQGELENLCGHVRSTLRLLKYTPRGSRDIEGTIMTNLKHIIGRGGLTKGEAQMLHGLCEQIRRRIKEGIG